MAHISDSLRLDKFKKVPFSGGIFISQ